MAKQTQLSNLLKSLHRAIYAHVDLSRTPNVSITDVRLKHTEDEVDKATKRIFSYFDKMQEKLDAAERDKTALRGQLTHMADECNRHMCCVQAAQKVGVTFRQERSPHGTMSWYVADLPGGTASAVPTINIPFDRKRAESGEAIEVLVSFDEWQEHAYQGMMLGLDMKTYVVHQHGKSSDFSRPDHVRMKRIAPTELTLYVNIARNQGVDGLKGAVYATSIEALAFANKHPGQHIVVAFPVKVTVTL